MLLFSELLGADGHAQPERDAGVFVAFDLRTPFPPSWETQLSVVNWVEGTLQIPSSDGGWEVGQTGEPLTARFRGSYFSTMVSQLVRAPLSVRPLISSPRGVTIDGQDAQAQSHVVARTQSRVQWGAPSLGTPTFYELDVFRVTIGVDASGARLAGSSFVGAIRAANRSITLPPGFLSPGERYFFGVCAWSLPNADLSRPMRTTLPSAKACAVTQVVTARSAPQ